VKTLAFRFDGASWTADGRPLTAAQASWYDHGVTDDSVEVFRRFHEAWTSGDLPDVLSLVDPEIVARPLHGILFTRSEFHGPDGIREWYREMTEPWDRFETVVEEAHPTPTGAVGLLRVVGYRGDEEFFARVGVVFEMRDGRILTLTARNVGDVENEIRAAAR
jgi:ketosteroid isomerase-like protein